MKTEDILRCVYCTVSTADIEDVMQGPSCKFSFVSLKFKMIISAIETETTTISKESLGCKLEIPNMYFLKF